MDEYKKALFLIDGEQYNDVVDITFCECCKYMEINLLEKNSLFETLNNKDMVISFIDENDKVVLNKIFKNCKFIKEETHDKIYHYEFEDLLSEEY